MDSVINQVEAKYKKKAVIDVHSGDTVRVHQKIREGGKERIQIFEGTVIRTSRPKSLLNSFTVRRIASGVGVEKTFLSHSPIVIKIEVTKRSKVRRNYLSYMRGLAGKGSRLAGVEFDRDAVHAEVEAEAEAEETKIKEEQSKQHEAEAAEKAEQAAEDEAKFEKAVAQHDDGEKAEAEKSDKKADADKQADQPDKTVK